MSATVSFINKPLVNSPDHPWQLKNQRPDCRPHSERPNKEAYGMSYPTGLEVDDVLDDEFKNSPGISFVLGALETGQDDENEYRPVEFSIGSVDPRL